jgi:hypothetical protein
MNLSIKIAGTIFTISFTGETERVVPLFHRFFMDFLHPGDKGDAGIRICIPGKAVNGLMEALGLQDRVMEQRVSIRDVSPWLKRIPEPEEDFLDDETIASFCLGGLLLFQPDRLAGRIYLLKEGPECFMPLLRLFWIYFAQVLGESKGCFVHSTALVKDKKGYLFLGESGAGKSTLARAAGESIVLSDDSPVFSKQNGDYRVFPSPYHQIDPMKGLGKEAAGMSAGVEAIYFLSRSRRIFREKVSRREAVSMILKRHILFFPYLSRRAKTDLFDLILGACEHIPVHHLHFCPDQDLWGTVIDG